MSVPCRKRRAPPSPRQEDSPREKTPLLPLPPLHLLQQLPTHYEEEGRVLVWRLPADISQSRMGGRTEPSNACTLIALRVAHLIERRHSAASHAPVRVPLGILPRGGGWTNYANMRSGAARWTTGHRMDTHSSLHMRRAMAGATESVPPPSHSHPHVHARFPCTMLRTFIEGMVEGNEAHARAIRFRAPDDQNFTIPDAIAALDNTVYEVDFCSVRGSFTANLVSCIRMALTSPVLLPLPRLYLAMIAFERTVLLVFERSSDSLVLLDSHLHGCADGSVAGGMMASALVADLVPFSQWMSEHIFPEAFLPQYKKEFELSVVIPRAELLKDEDAPESVAKRTRRGGRREDETSNLPVPPLNIQPQSIFAKELPEDAYATEEAENVAPHFPFPPQFPPLHPSFHQFNRSIGR